MNIVLTAGGTGGHIFPALSVALELKKACSGCSLVWIGTARNREKELCEKNNIPLRILKVTGVSRGNVLSMVESGIKFIAAWMEMMLFFRRQKADAVIAFGGYVCAPVLAAASFYRLPYFLQEQNSVPGFVNRHFSRRARCTFLGFPVGKTRALKGTSIITGTPVRIKNGSLDQFPFPMAIDRSVTTVLICGGSQGAASMNECLIGTVKKLTDSGLQVVWQTGEVSFDKISCQMAGHDKAFIVPFIDDLYPYYAIAKVLIGRSGASTLSEAAYFALPVVMIPLPWSADNHQWKNAGIVEQQGWGMRIEQNQQTSGNVEQAVLKILQDEKMHEKMRHNASQFSPEKAAGIIVKTVLSQVKN